MKAQAQAPRPTVVIHETRSMIEAPSPQANQLIRQTQLGLDWLKATPPSLV